MNRKLHLPLVYVQLWTVLRMWTQDPCIWRWRYLIPLDNLGILWGEPGGNWATRCLQSLQSSECPRLPSAPGTGSWPYCPHGKSHGSVVGAVRHSFQEMLPKHSVGKHPGRNLIPAQQVCTQPFWNSSSHLGFTHWAWSTGYFELVFGFPTQLWIYARRGACFCVFWQRGWSPKRNAEPWLLEEQPSWVGAVYLTVRSETTDCTHGCVWGVNHKPPLSYLTLWAGFFSLLV